MNLYFLRHTTPFDGSPDEERRLTPGGHEEAGRLGSFLVGAGVTFDAAYSSPLIRAIETAEDVTKLTNAGALRNEASQEDFQQWLNSLPPLDHILLVGHAPKLGERVGVMLGMEQPHAFGLSKGGLACVETADRLSGGLKFLVSPKILRD
jgi:phosphohistidine phosphatase